MRTFLVFMVLFVSGDDEMMKTITGVIEGSVLLPCTCSERNSDKRFQWQMEEPNKMLVLKYNLTLNFSDRYNGRAHIFLPENSDNCSILLTNITAADLGMYRCIFFSQEKYKKVFVYLNISAHYNVCLRENISFNLFQCDVKGRYKEADIQWNLDGQLLTDSPETRITHTKTLDAASGLYHLTSNLTTKLNGTSKPTCDVKAKGLSTIISFDCPPVNDYLMNSNITQPEEFTRRRNVKIIPIILMLGICLVLWRRWKLSQGYEKDCLLRLLR